MGCQFVQCATLFDCSSTTHCVESMNSLFFFRAVRPTEQTTYLDPRGKHGSSVVILWFDSL
jgi:hypothetical protein